MGSFEAFYQSPLQHPWLLWLSALVGLTVCLRQRGLDASLRRYAAALAVLSLADAWLSAPHVYGVGTLTGAASSAVPLFFVLAGDFRFLLLLGAGTAEGRFQTDARGVLLALGLTLIVPLTSQLAMSLLPGEPGSRVLFLVYELLFFALTVALLAYHPGPRRAPWLRSVGRFVAIYYGLWAAADALILTTGLDAGFALRVLPNVLYYGGLIGVIGWAAARR